MTARGAPLLPSAAAPSCVEVEEPRLRQPNASELLLSLLGVCPAGQGPRSYRPSCWGLLLAPYEVPWLGAAPGRATCH